jgi:hypothetical protein
VSVVMAGGAPHPFIVVGEGHTGRGRGKRPTVMALTPLKAGQLDEGIKGGESRWESEDFDWHLDVGGRAAHGGRRQREEAVT